MKIDQYIPQKEEKETSTQIPLYAPVPLPEVREELEIYKGGKESTFELEDLEVDMSIDLTI